MRPDGQVTAGSSPFAWTDADAKPAARIRPYAGSSGSALKSPTTISASCAGEVVEPREQALDLGDPERLVRRDVVEVRDREDEPGAARRSAIRTRWADRVAPRSRRSASVAPQRLP